MNELEYLQFQSLWNRLTIDLGHPLCLSQNVNNGRYVVFRYSKEGNITDFKEGGSIQECCESLIAADVTRKLVTHDIIG